MGKQTTAEPGREVLPIPNQPYAGPILYDAKDPAVVFPPIQEIRTPAGAPNTYNRSFRITAEADLPASGAEGALIALGGVEGGWSFAIEDGKLVFHYNWIMSNQYRIASASPVPTGKTTLTADFTYDGGGMGKGATVALSANGAKVGEGRVDKTVLLLYGTDGFDIGGDYGSPVSPDYTAPFPFTGTLEHVTIDLL